MENGFLREELAEQRSFGRRAIFIQVTSEAQDDFLGIQFLAGGIGRAMLRAAAAFHAGVRLKRRKLGEQVVETVRGVGYRSQADA